MICSEMHSLLRAELALDLRYSLSPALPRTLYYFLVRSLFPMPQPLYVSPAILFMCLLIDLLGYEPICFSRLRAYSQQHQAMCLTHIRYSIMFEMIVKPQKHKAAYPGTGSSFSNTY